MDGKILGFVPEADLLDFSQNFLVTRPANPLDALFPDQKTDNLFATYETLAAGYQIPEMAPVHALDTEADIAGRIPIDTVNIEKFLIKRKINQTESLRMRMRSVPESALKRYVLDDGAMLAEQVNTRTKVAKGELMSTGKLTIKENNLSIDVDYHVPADNTTLSVDWSAADPNVPGDLQRLMDTFADAGVQVNGVLTSRKALTFMRQNSAMQKVTMGNIGVGATVPAQMFNDYMSSEYGLTNIIALDSQYAVRTGVNTNGRPILVNHRFYPQNKMTFFFSGPGGSVGTGLWGVTPEEEGMGPYTAKSQQQFITVTQWEEPDPRAVWTKASGMFVPVLPNPSGLFIVTITFPTASAASEARSALKTK